MFRRNLKRVVSKRAKIRKENDRVRERQERKRYQEIYR